MNNIFSTNSRFSVLADDILTTKKQKNEFKEDKNKLNNTSFNSFKDNKNVYNYKNEVGNAIMTTKKASSEDIKAS